MKKYILLGTLFFFVGAKAQLLVNNTTFTPVQLVQNSLVGPGVTPYNILFNGVPGTVIRDQIAKFTTNFNPTNLGLSNGLLLSTGNAQIAIGPNNVGNKSQVTTSPTIGDPDLALLCGQTVRNVSVVEFDFVATGQELNFDYVFASEEYPEFANSTFNDTFGFFLRGPGLTGPFSGNAQNIALIPTSTTVPITINNVNNGTANAGPCEYCIYYVNNGTGTTPAANTSIQYDGFTTPLRAHAPLQCGQVYHIKLAVGNVSDNQYDSAVFLKNFTIQPLELVVTDLSGTPSIPLCFGTINSINSGLPATGTTNVYQWDFEGVAIPGETTPNFPAVPASPPVALTPGTYTLNVYTPTGCLLATDDIEISYRPEAPIQEPLDITLCTMAAPPYTVNIDQTTYILGALDPDLYEVSFYDTNLADAMAGGVTGLIPFANWASYNIISVPTTIWATVLDLVTDCKTVRPFEINVTPTPSGTISFPQLSYCTDVTNTPITTNVTPGGIYSATPAGLTIDPATGAINPSTSTPNNYTVHYDLAASGTCPAYSAPTIPLTVAAVPATPTITVVQPTCTVTTGSITITAPVGSDLEYSIDNGVTYQSSPVFNPVPSGYAYQILAHNTISNCSSVPLGGIMNPVLGVPLPATASVTVQPDCVTPTGTIVVSSPTGANVEYSINGGTSYQSSATFAGLTPNVTYNITVRDVNTGCLSAATPYTINALPASPAAPAGTITQPTCLVPTATINLTSPLGADLEYSIDGGTTYLPWVNFPWLTPNANYSISVRNTTTSCISPTTVFAVNAIPANPSAPAGTLVQPTCSVITGSYTLTAPVGTDLQYSLDGGTTYQSGLSFPTLTANTSYPLTAYDTVTGCTSAVTTLNVNPILAVPASATASTTVQPICTSPTGTILVTAPFGTNLEYSANGGTTYQASTTFAGLAPNASYSIVVRNTVSGCTSVPVSVSVDPLPAGPVAPTASVTFQPDCIIPTGTLVVSSPTGTNVEYSINGGTSYQSSTTFAGLTPNTTFNISVRDVITGCLSAATPYTVNALPVSPAAPIGGITQPNCFVPTATIALTSPLGATLEYSIDGGATYQSGLTFAGLAPNATYSISVRNTTTSCISSATAFVVNAIPANPSAPAGTLVQPTCSVTTGSYALTSPVGSDLQYSLDGGTTYQSGLSFPALTANTTYSLTAYNTLTGCTSAPTTVNINPILAVPASATASTTIQPICTVPTGTIVVTAPLGSNLEYSANGGTTYQASTTFAGLAPNASYSIVVRNTVSGCTSVPVSVSVDPLPAGPVAPSASVSVQPDCFTPTATILVSSPTGTNVEYSINGGTSYQSSATFAGLVPNTTYNITVRDVNTRCISTATAVLVNPIPANPVAPSGTITQPICATPTGTIVLTAPLGTTLEYSIDGGTTYQAGVTFAGLAPNSTYSITVRNTVTGCLSSASTFAIIPAPNVPATPSAACNVACVGESLYLTTPTLAGATYSWTGPNGYTSSFQNPVILSAQLDLIGTYQVVVALTPDCPSLPGSVTISVNPLPTVQVQGGAICVDATGAVLSPFVLNTMLSPTDFSFQWYSVANNTATLLSGTDPTYLANIPGRYGIVITDLSTSCESGIASAEVVLMPKPESLVLETSAYFADAQVIYANVLPVGVYEYQLDGGNFQSSNVFGGVSTGTHTVTVRDLNHCGELSDTVELLDFPRFFTPNGDTYNDTWNIFELGNQANAKIYIFDRLGKLLKQLSPADPGWDGTFNNKDLPASDYWFVVYYKEKNEDKIFKSHFALKR
jgi:gliding motility-associated-like protein